MLQDWDELLDRSDGYTIHLSVEEAMFVDWITTLHSWDYELFERLNNPELKILKEEIGKVILKQKEFIEIEPEAFKFLFTICPITFRFGYGEDLGFFVKTKLYRCLISGDDGWEEEQRKKAEEAAKNQQQAPQYYDE